MINIVGIFTAIMFAFLFSSSSFSLLFSLSSLPLFSSFSLLCWWWGIGLAALAKKLIRRARYMKYLPNPNLQIPTKIHTFDLQGTTHTIVASWRGTINLLFQFVLWVWTATLRYSRAAVGERWQWWEQGRPLATGWCTEASPFLSISATFAKSLLCGKAIVGKQ